jgi:hypothetical protein
MKNKKMLATLLGMATWVTVALHAALGDGRSIESYDLGKFAAEAIAYSLPGLLFGGILLWWFRK